MDFRAMMLPVISKQVDSATIKGDFLLNLMFEVKLFYPFPDWKMNQDLIEIGEAPYSNQGIPPQEV
jgi:hypothetical protein